MLKQKINNTPPLLTSLGIILLLIVLPIIIIVVTRPQQTITDKYAQASTLQPIGVGGNWNLIFDDEFNGTSLDTSKWSPQEGGTTNNVTTHASNIAVSGGNLILTLANSSSGAEACTCNTSSNFMLPVGAYAEARVNFPGNGTTIYNWPAWWASGPNWPAAGESDIAEGLGTLTVNYHSPSGAHNQGTIPGIWSNGFHTYGLYRHATSADVYWDGKLVKSYPTNDNGAGESLILNVGRGNGGVFGTSSHVLVDYVRAWLPCTSSCSTTAPSSSPLIPTFGSIGDCNTNHNCPSGAPAEGRQQIGMPAASKGNPINTHNPSTSVSQAPTANKLGHNNRGFIQLLLQFLQMILQLISGLFSGR